MAKRERGRRKEVLAGWAPVRADAAGHRFGRMRLGALRASARPVRRARNVAGMSDRSSQDQQPEQTDDELTADPYEDREAQEEDLERAETVDGALSPGSTADDSPTSRGE